MANYEKNLTALKEHLDSNETIKTSVFGSYEGKLMGNDTIRSGVLAATDKRVVFFAKKLFGFEMESFLFKNISSVEKSKGLMGHAITINASGNDVKMKWIQKGEIEKFTEFVNSNLGVSSEASSVEAKVDNDIPSQIKKLSELLEQGILTEEEFSTKKQQLLDKM